MKLKSLIQISLSILVLIICGIIYYQYFYEQQSRISNEKLETLEKEKKKLSGNIIKNIEYKSEDAKGNLYIIKSKKGEFKDQENDIIFMTDVTAIMRLKDKTTIKLSSLNAKYNIIDSNTNFFNNVSLDYLDHNVVAENIDIFFKDGKLEAYNDLVYRNLDLSLIADKVEIDLITKNSKIFMFDDKKVKVLKAN
jgi:hypothetical protein